MVGVRDVLHSWMHERRPLAARSKASLLEQTEVHNFTLAREGIRLFVVEIVHGCKKGEKAGHGCSDESRDVSSGTRMMR